MSSTPMFKDHRNTFYRPLLACFVLLFFAAMPLYAQTYTDLSEFNCGESSCAPIISGALTQVSDGSFDGTGGGAFPQTSTILNLPTVSPYFPNYLGNFNGTAEGAVVLDIYGNLYTAANGGRPPAMAR